MEEKKNNNKRAFEKVKRTTLCSDFEDGGLKMIDLKELQTSFLLQWVSRLTSKEISDRWKMIPTSLFSCFGTTSVCFNSNVDSKVFKGLENIKSEFWSLVLKTWLDNNYVSNDTIFNPILWNNKQFLYNGKPLYFQQWAKKSILTIHDMLFQNHCISYERLCENLERSPQTLLEYFTVRSIVVAFLKKILQV